MLILFKQSLRSSAFPGKFLRELYAALMTHVHFSTPTSSHTLRFSLWFLSAALEVESFIQWIQFENPFFSLAWFFAAARLLLFALFWHTFTFTSTYLCTFWYAHLAQSKEPTSRICVTLVVVRIGDIFYSVLTASWWRDCKRNYFVGRTDYLSGYKYLPLAQHAHRRSIHI